MTGAADRFALAACAAPGRRVQSRSTRATPKPAVMDEKKAAILGEIP
ncbi:RNA polymerase sigma factor, partial [Mesorhizobium sp. M7A.F.Ca.CA.001.06.1.1]